MESGMSGSSEKSRVDKLDEAFLFLISLTSIIFMVIQAFSGGVTLVLYSIPLLIFGVGVPFYYGYWRGALKDSPIMRVRGWIYLSFGAVGYVTFVIFFNATISGSITVFVTGLVSYALYLYLFKRFRFKILYCIFEICNKEVSLFDAEIVRDTAIAAFFLLIPLISCIILVLNLEYLFSHPVFMVFFLFLLLFLPPGVLGELNSWKILKNYERLCCESVHWEFLERHRRFTMMLFLLYFLFIVIMMISMLLIFKGNLSFLYIYVISLAAVSGLSVVLSLSSPRKVYKWKYLTNGRH
jgi:hypothetical protein